MIDPNLPMHEYLAMDALGSGTAHRIIDSSPLHALYSMTSPRDSSPVSNKGEIAHRILLEGHTKNIVSVQADDWRTKDAREQRDAAYADGMIPILDREMEPIKSMVVAAERFIDQSEIAGAFDNGNPEVTVTWNDGGVECKARPDYLSPDFHISVKTTNIVGGANPAYYSRRLLASAGHDFGLMFYRRGLMANDIDVKHRILVIEQNRPYGCCLVSLAPSKMAIAESQVERSISTWRECLATGIYPGYGYATFEAEASPWELAEEEERQVDEIFEGVE